MNNYIIRLDQGVYAPHSNYLKNEFGFKDLFLYKKKKERLVSKRLLVMESLQFILFLIQNLAKIKRTHTIVSMGWPSIFIKLLIKFRIIHCEKFYWLGFFIHQKKFFSPLKGILQASAIPQEQYIVNSESDLQMYQCHLGISASKLKVLPYGDFSTAFIGEEEIRTHVGNYYFAGGFTNRDYRSLIAAFRELDQKLIIVGSHLNKDLDVIPPPNIEILRDIPKKQFSTLVKNARACILPLKERTGASGQMVLLNYMKQGKAIIAPDMQIAREYVEEGVAALFYQDAKQEIPSIIRYLEQDEEKIIQLGVIANQSYNQNLGGETIKERLSEILLLKPARLSRIKNTQDK